MLSAASRAAAGVVRWLFLAVSGAAGTVIGAVVGLLTGFTDEDGLMEATLTRATVGAVVSLELADSLVRIWSLDGCSMDSRIRSTLLLLPNFAVGGSMFPTMGSASEGLMDQRQPPYSSRGDLFQRRAAVERLPARTVTKEETGASGQPQTTCPICLDEFQAGERSRRLPACCHVFHAACIDSWLLWKSQCPMCRHAVY